MKFLDSIINWFKAGDKRTQVYTPLDASIMQQNKALMEALATRTAELSKYKAQLKELTPSKSKEETEQKIIRELNTQQRKIRKDQIGETVSLVKFILAEAKLTANGRIKWKKPIELTDKDDSEVFGLLNDIQVSTKTGNLLITDHYQNVMAYSPRFNGIVYKPNSFGNQIKRRRILLPKTKDFENVIDLDEIEVNDVIYEPDEVATDNEGNPLVDPETGEEKKGVFYSTENYRRRFRELLEGREKDLRKKDEYIERLEVAQINQRKELTDIKRALTNYKNLNNTTESEYSKILGHNLQMVAVMGDVQRKVSNLTQLKAMYEKELLVRETMHERALEEIEKLGGKSARQIIEEEWKEKLEWARNILPETVPMEMPKESKDNTPVQPGEVIGQRRNV